MKCELIGGYVPAASDREQIGRFLRQAFPLDPGSFAEVPRGQDTGEAKTPSRHQVPRLNEYPLPGSPLAPRNG